MATSSAGVPVRKQGPIEAGWSKGMHLSVAVVSSFTLFSSSSEPAHMILKLSASSLGGLQSMWECRELYSVAAESIVVKSLSLAHCSCGSMRSTDCSTKIEAAEAAGTVGSQKRRIYSAAVTGQAVCQACRKSGNAWHDHRHLPRGP